MNQSTGCVPAAPCQLNISGAINTLEDHQHTLDNMLNSLECILYGGDLSKASDCQNAKNNDGFESRLNDLVVAKTASLNQLERILSKI